MDDARIHARLAELGIELPSPPVPVAAYVPVVISGTIAHVAGQVPMVEGKIVHGGHVGQDVSVDDAADAARRAALQSLAALRDAMGSFGPVRRILSVTVFVAATPDFVEHPKVANGASELLVDVLGEQGKHVRASVGASSLPLGASVEVQLTAELGTGGSTN